MVRDMLRESCVLIGRQSYLRLAEVITNQQRGQILLDITRINNIEYLPCEVVSTANDKSDNIVYLLYDKANTAVDNNNNNETVIDIIMTDHTKDDWTILGDNRLYDLITWNNPCLLYTSRCV